MSEGNAEIAIAHVSGGKTAAAMTIPGSPDGGAILHPAHELATGIGGTIERWTKASWDKINHAWHYTQEHAPHLLHVAHWHMTPLWAAAIGGAGAVGAVAAIELYMHHRKKKRQSKA
jgi:hypothetical protein